MPAPKWLSVEEVIEEIGVSRSTWNKWRAKRQTPPAKRLPNGSLRIRQDDLNDWLDNLEAA